MSYGVKIDLDTIIGKKYGFLTIISAHRELKGKRNRIICETLCDCGKHKQTQYDYLIQGKTTSCGCKTMEMFRSHKCTHGMTDSRLYHIWTGMKSRCYNKNNPKYISYGHRGIKLYSEWVNNFSNFYEWAVRNGYENDLTIERIDVDRDYSPYNCTWIPLSKQADNKTCTIKFTIDGETKTLKEWCNIYNNTWDCVYNRIYALHWDIYDAITLPKYRKSDAE